MLTLLDRENNKQKFLRTLHTVERPGIEEIINWLTFSDFFRAPASTRFHGCYEGALATHSYGVYERFSTLIEVTPDIEVSEDSRKIAGLLYDVCKIDYYVKNYGELGLVDSLKPWKVQDEMPLGHGEKSVILLMKEGLEMTEQERMLIRWHMGGFDPSWRQYERDVLAKHPEVLLLHHADQTISVL